MSNINPNPRFVPTPGKPVPARQPDALAKYAWGQMGVYTSHRNLAEITAQEEHGASVKDGKFRHCWGCVARSVCPWPADCPRSQEMAA